MTKLTTEELRELLEKATPGPWAVKYNRGCTFLQTPEGDTMCDEPYYPWAPENDADWHLIAAAPDLAAEVLTLRAEVEKLREALTHIDSIDPQDQQMAGLSDHAARGLINAAGSIARAALDEGGA